MIKWHLVAVTKYRKRIEKRNGKWMRAKLHAECVFSRLCIAYDKQRYNYKKNTHTTAKKMTATTKLTTVVISISLHYSFSRRLVIHLLHPYPNATDIIDKLHFLCLVHSNVCFSLLRLLLPFPLSWKGYQPDRWTDRHTQKWYTFYAYQSILSCMHTLHGTCSVYLHLFMHNNLCDSFLLVNNFGLPFFCIWFLRC